MRIEIQSIADLGRDWVLLGAPKGDTSMFELSSSARNKVVFVKAKKDPTSQTSDDIVYVLGARKWLMDPEGQRHLAKLQENKLKRQVQPVPNDRLIKEIYKEWESRAASGQSGKEDKSKEHENVQKVETVFIECLKENVSDIHLEVGEHGAVLRRRINGVLKDYQKLTPLQGEEWGRTVYNVLTSIASTSLKPDQTQDALVDRVVGLTRVRGRVATAPAYPNGFTMVIRLLKDQDNVKPLTTEELGYSAREQRNIKYSTSKTKGINCWSGTTGSGKSTSLQAILSFKMLERAGEVKVITVEDPVEYEIPGAVQIPVKRGANGDASDAFSAAIRSALRLDPDWLMVGECRDKQSAQLVRTIVDTGHPVFTTVHASGCIQTISRFENLGIDRETLAGPEFISGLYYQKLLPKICPHCAKTIENDVLPVRMGIREILRSLNIMRKDQIDNLHRTYSTSKTSLNFLRYLQDRRQVTSKQASQVTEAYKRFNDPKENKERLERLASVADLKSDRILFKGEGCHHCKDGVIGRTVVSEGLCPDMAMLEMIADGADRDLISYWRKNQQGKFAIEDAIDKMRRGIVDPIDIEHEVGKLGEILM